MTSNDAMHPRAWKIDDTSVPKGLFSDFTWPILEKLEKLGSIVIITENTDIFSSLCVIYVQESI